MRHHLYTCLVCAVVVALACDNAPEGRHLRLERAVLAMKGGAGGCATAGSVELAETQPFAGALLFQGRCVMEHGDTAHVYLAADTGTVYLLDSPSSFRFLLLNHPPLVPSDSAGLLRYGLLALKLSGHSWTRSVFIEKPSQVPDSSLEAIGLSPETVPVSFTERRNEGVTVVHVVTLERKGLVSHDLFIYDDGDISIVRRVGATAE